MITNRLGLGVWAVLGSLCLVSACGGGGDIDKSEVTPGGGGTAPGSAGSSNTAGTLGDQPDIGVGDAGSDSGNGSGSGGDGSGQACASANQQAELAPVYLVFLLDESGSMGDGEYGDRTKKWDPVTAALKAFFADDASAGITASLSLFPLDQNKGTGPAQQNMPADCNDSAYFDPVVTPRALPDATAFASAIDVLSPPNEYGTPTRPALAGTIDYAESLLAEDPTRKVVVVMVTDGDPVSCTGNTVEATADEAAAVADHIPTYVIGVGESLTSLDAIAEGGGTDKAMIVALDNPTQTRQDLLDAVNLIRGKAISCDLKIPAPPVGKKLDPDKVEVEFTASGAAPAALPYAPDCAGGQGWHYDDAAKPSEILLCDATCDSVKADATGKLEVVFGCEVRDDVVK